MKYKSVSFLLLTSVLLFAASCSKQTDDQKADEAISKLSLKQKLDLLGGTGFATKPIDSLGIPEIKMSDGPLGVRWEKATAFPAAVALASTWDTTLAYEVGVVLGQETKAKGRDMLLGPCIGIVRTPQGGRNFESYGEDPFLNGRFATSWIKGLQSEKVLASVKHYAVNNQEFERTTISAKVSDRALREIYLPAFKAAVQEGDAKTVMAAYNKINGQYAAENTFLLNQILKKEWGFSGFVVSDWGAVHSSLETALNGNDLEMPTGYYMNPDSLTKYVESGKLPIEIVNDKIKRMLKAAYWAGLDKKDSMRYKAKLNTPDHQQLARKVATESIVLLKNESNILPLEKSSLKKIAIIGPNAAVARTGGGGSSMVEPFYSVSVLEAVKEKLAGKVEVGYAMGVPPYGEVTIIPAKHFSHLENGNSVPGLMADYFPNKMLEGKPSVTVTDSNIDHSWDDNNPVKGIEKDNYSVRWTGFLTPDVSGKYRIDGMSDDGIRIFVDGKLVVENWTDHATETKSGTLELKAGKSYSIKVEFYENGGGAVAKLGWQKPGVNIMAEAIALAKNSDAVILCVGNSFMQESEGYDRPDLNLPEGQEELVKAISAANPKTVVVLTNGQPLLMENWIGKVPAVVESWFGGQEGGHAVADILFGDANPSGKLTVTFPKKWEDSPSFGNYPGKNGEVHYAEGIYVGYRFYETKNVEPQFPFGFGLSYTSYEYSNLKINKTGDQSFEVSCTVKNTGKRDGSEVVQLYVHDVESSVDRPIRELKSFSKVALKAGEEKTITMKLNAGAFSFYDESKKSFVVEPGEFEIQVGASVKDIRLKEKITL